MRCLSWVWSTFTLVYLGVYRWGMRLAYSSVVLQDVQLRHFSRRFPFFAFLVNFLDIFSIRTLYYWALPKSVFFIFQEKQNFWRHLQMAEVVPVSFGNLQATVVRFRASTLWCGFRTSGENRGRQRRHPLTLLKIAPLRAAPEEPDSILLHAYLCAAWRSHLHLWPFALELLEAIRMISKFRTNTKHIGGWGFIQK